MNQEEQRISNNISKAYGIDIEKARGKVKKIGELDKSGKNIKTANGWVPVKKHGSTSIKKKASPKPKKANASIQDDVAGPDKKGGSKLLGFETYDVKTRMDRAVLFSNYEEKYMADHFETKWKSDLSDHQKNEIREAFFADHGRGKDSADPEKISELLGGKLSEKNEALFAIESFYIRDHEKGNYTDDMLNSVTEKTKKVVSLIEKNKDTFQNFIASLYPDTESANRVVLRSKDFDIITDDLNTAAFKMEYRPKKWDSNRPNIGFKCVLSNGKINTNLKAMQTNTENSLARFPDSGTKERLELEKKLVDRTGGDSSSNAKHDDELIDLQKIYDNYHTLSRHSHKQSTSNLSRKDENTLHFHVGDIGKKKQVHDTIRDAFSLSVPSSIGDYKLQGITNGEKIVSKRDHMKRALEVRENDYSEYENDYSITYVYTKK